MDSVFLARIQFAVTICFHFIFPPVSIGLGLMLCVSEWLGWRKNNPVYVRMSKLFADLFGITFAVGVATGIVMLFQFGSNWGNYSRFVANIIGVPLAAEGFFAFFLESSFMGLYIFGRGRVSKGLHWFSLLMVALGAATLSAFFIIAGNSWLQTPAGYVINNGQAELTNLYEAIFNPSTLPRYFHVITACIFTGSIIYASVGAWHVLRDKDSLIGRKALAFGVVTGLILICLEVAPIGHWHAEQVARTQPEKFAAIEGIYSSQKGAPFIIFGIPSIENGSPEIKARLEIPKLTSLLAFDDADAHVKGIRDFPPEDWPPLIPVFVTYRLMIGLGIVFIVLMLIAALRLAAGKIYEDRRLLKVLVWSAPLPVVAIELGWLTAEIGRQPWVVYKLLRTSDAATPLSPQELGFSLAMFTSIYLFLFALWLFLMIRKAKEEPL